MMIDQRACVNAANISLDLDGNIDGSGSSAASTTYYVYAVDDNVPAGTFSMKFRTSNADNFTGERKIGSVTTASSGSPPNIETITDDDATTAVEEKLVKAWVMADGTGTAAIQDSFNVSSITDNGTGDYTVTFDTDFANAFYATAGLAMSTATQGIQLRKQNTAQVVGSINIEVLNTAGTNGDAEFSLMAIGDQ
jgi:hypothetical protein